MRFAAPLVSTGLLLCLALPPVVASAEAAAPDSLPAPAVRVWQTGLLRPDRLEHVSLSFTLGCGVGLVSHRPAAAATAALTLGLAKEVRDRRRGGFDALDLVADAIGAGLAVALLGASDH